MAISFITAKTYPQKLQVPAETINEIVSGPVNAIDKSPILKDNQDILDVLFDYEPATLSVELSRQLSKIEDIFKSKVEEDLRLTDTVKQLTRRIGTVRPATVEEDKEQEVLSLSELAKEALANAKRKK
jgi:gp040